jgi:hypothetical protein
MDSSKGFSLTDLAVALVLAVATWFAYAPVTRCDFVSYDDPLYVTNNDQVQQGLTSEGVVWAFTTGRGNNWNPLTWLSHMLDVEMHGLDAGGHHTTSLLLHLLNTLLLFLLLKLLTGTSWRSGFVAALFALHPLHVEAVAWIADRKGVLSTTFWMLACLAYVRYVRRRSKGWFAASIAFFTLGLLAKPMVVTLPFVLLLLDAWPLERFEGGLRPLRSFVATHKGILIEKVPFLAVAAASSVVTYFVQQQTGAVRTYEEIPLLSCLANAAISYPTYIVQTFWPVDLAFFYPHPREAVVLWLAVLALAGLVLVSLMAWFFRRRFPAGFVGWFWFIGTLVPMIGVIQFGRQARADRFTYIPLIGFFIIIVWGFTALLGRNLVQRRLLTAAGGGVLVVLGILTQAQVRTWMDDESLYRHALEVTEDNFIARSMLANALMARKDYHGAELHYSEAIRIFPDQSSMYVNLGRARLKLGKISEAIADLRQALEHTPDDAAGHAFLALALLKEDNRTEAEEHLRRAIDIDPDAYLARFNLGILLLNTRRFDEAEEHLSHAVRIDPGNANARKALSHVRAQRK